MKKILFTAAGTTLMAGAAMAQAVVPTPTPNVTGPTSTIVTTNSSTLMTGLDNSTCLPARRASSSPPRL
jgi:hypothetical protein